MEMAPKWMAREYIAGALLDVDELVRVLDTLLRWAHGDRPHRLRRPPTPGMSPRPCMTGVGIVTGAASGIGGACAASMVGTVDVLVLVDLDPDATAESWPRVERSGHPLRSRRRRHHRCGRRRPHGRGGRGPTARCIVSCTPPASPPPWPSGTGSSPSTWSVPPSWSRPSVLSPRRGRRSSAWPRWRPSSSPARPIRPSTGSSTSRWRRASSTTTGRLWGRRRGSRQRLRLGQARGPSPGCPPGGAVRCCRRPDLLGLAGHDRHTDGPPRVRAPAGDAPARGAGAARSIRPCRRDRRRHRFPPLRPGQLRDRYRRPGRRRCLRRDRADAVAAAQVGSGRPGTSSTRAVDIPPPAHMAATPAPPPRRRISLTREITMRAPVMAMG